MTTTEVMTGVLTLPVRAHAPAYKKQRFSRAATRSNGTTCKSGTTSPATWVDEHGDVMYRYTLAQVHDPQTAQDLVQDTLLAALRGRDQFRGRCSERTWLFGILKHKITDYFRRSRRSRTVEMGDTAYDDADRLFLAAGKWQGHWRSEAAPHDWAMDPATTFEQKEFWRVLQRCIAELPPRLARVFWLREVEGISSDEICRTMEISSANLWVMLHRARTQLRASLERTWFDSDAGDVR